MKRLQFSLLLLVQCFICSIVANSQVKLKPGDYEPIDLTAADPNFFNKDVIYVPGESKQPKDHDGIDGEGSFFYAESLVSDPNAAYTTSTNHPSILKANIEAGGDYWMYTHVGLPDDGIIRSELYDEDTVKYANLKGLYWQLGDYTQKNAKNVSLTSSNSLKIEFAEPRIYDEINILYVLTNSVDYYQESNLPKMSVTLEYFDDSNSSSSVDLCREWMIGYYKSGATGGMKTGYPFYTAINYPIARATKSSNNITWSPAPNSNTMTYADCLRNCCLKFDNSGENAKLVKSIIIKNERNAKNVTVFAVTGKLGAAVGPEITKYQETVSGITDYTDGDKQLYKTTLYWKNAAAIKYHLKVEEKTKTGLVLHNQKIIIEAKRGLDPSYEIEGLKPGMVYRYMVASEGNDGSISSYSSNPREFATPITSQSVNFDNVKVTNTNNCGLRVSWDLLSELTAVTGYRVELYTGIDDTGIVAEGDKLTNVTQLTLDNRVAVTEVGATVSSCDFSNLIPGQKYYISVTPTCNLRKDENGNDELGLRAYARGAIAPVENAEIENLHYSPTDITAGTGVLTWTPMEGDAIVGYKVYIKDGNSDKTLVKEISGRNVSSWTFGNGGTESPNISDTNKTVFYIAPILDTDEFYLVKNTEYTFNPTNCVYGKFVSFNGSGTIVTAEVGFFGEQFGEVHTKKQYYTDGDFKDKHKFDNTGTCQHNVDATETKQSDMLKHNLTVTEIGGNNSVMEQEISNPNYTIDNLKLGALYEFKVRQEMKQYYTAGNGTGQNSTEAWTEEPCKNHKWYKDYYHEATKTAYSEFSETKYYGYIEGITIDQTKITSTSTTSSLTFNWTNDFSAVNGYDVVLKKKSDGTTITKSIGDVTTVTFDNLNPATEYEFSITPKSTISGVNGTAGTTTKDAFTSFQVKNMNVTDIKSTSAKVTWDKLADESKISEYTVTVYDENGDKVSSKGVAKGSANPECTLSGLSMGTEYRVTVEPKVVTGLSSAATSKSFNTTSFDTSAKVENLQCSAQTDTTLTFTWEAPEGVTNITKYKLVFDGVEKVIDATDSDYGDDDLAYLYKITIEDGDNVFGNATIDPLTKHTLKVIPIGGTEEGTENSADGISTCTAPVTTATQPTDTENATELNISITNVPEGVSGKVYIKKKSDTEWPSTPECTVTAGSGGKTGSLTKTIEDLTPGTEYEIKFVPERGTLQAADIIFEQSTHYFSASIANLEATADNDKSITLDWDACDENTGTDKYYIIFSTKEDVKTNTVGRDTVVVNGIDVITKTISKINDEDLSPLTKYYFYIVPYFDTTAGTESDVVSAITKINSDVKISKTDMVLTPGATSIGVSWKAVDNAESYKVTLKDKDGNVVKDASNNDVILTIDASTAVDGKLSCTLPDLTEASKYKVEIVPVYDGEEGGAVEKETTTKIGTVKVEGFGVDSGNSTSVTLEWTELADKYNAVNGYTIIYSQDPDFASDKVTTKKIDGKATTSTTISGLDPAEKYYFKIAPNISGTNTENYTSPAVDFSTDFDDSIVINNFKVLDTESESIKLGWDELNKSAVTGYKILYSTDENMESGVATKSVSGKDVTSVVIDGLLPGHKYYFEIVPVSDAGEGNASKTNGTTDFDSNVLIPADHIDVTPSYTLVDITLTEPEYDGIDKYELELWKDGVKVGETIILTPDDLTTTFKDLESNTDYTLKVTMKDKEGNASGTTEIPVKTKDLDAVQVENFVVDKPNSNVSKVTYNWDDLSQTEPLLTGYNVKLYDSNGNLIAEATKLGTEINVFASNDYGAKIQAASDYKAVITPILTENGKELFGHPVEKGYSSPLEGIQVKDVVVTNPNDNSTDALEVTWTKLTASKVVGYNVYYSLYPNMRDETRLYVSGINNSSAKLEGLKSGEKYYIQVAGTTGNDPDSAEGERSDLTWGITYLAGGETLDSAIETKTGYTYAEIKLTPSTLDAIEKYIVELKDAEGNVFRKEISSSDDLTFLFDGLTPNTEYTVSVWGEDAKGTKTAVNSDTKIRTKNLDDAKVDGLEISKVTEDSVTIEWDGINDDTVTPEGYKVTILDKNGNKIGETTVTDNQVTFSDLDPATDYTIVITPIISENGGAPMNGGTSDVDFKTAIDLPDTPEGGFTYTGEEITLIPDSDSYTVENGKQTDAGTYDVIVTPKPGYQWPDGTTGPKTIEYTIKPAQVDVPVVDVTSFIYDGETHDFGFDSNANYDINGPTSGKEAGKYIVTVTPKKNYAWPDGTTTPKEFTFYISDFNFTDAWQDTTVPALPGGNAIIVTELTGNVDSYSVSCKDNEALSIEDADFDNDSKQLTLPINSNITPGTYTVTVTLKVGDTIQTQEVEIAINYPEAFIVLLWNDVLVVDNSEEKFVGYQWYKWDEEKGDYIAIDGARDQFLNEVGGVFGTYKVEVTLSDGTKATVGPKTYGNINSRLKATVNPNPVQAGVNFTVNINGLTDEELRNAEILIYDMNGTIVNNLTTVSQSNTLVLARDGIYVVVVTSGDQKDVVKLLVR
ncbi:MAG: fibronectin type III domain-containing protein [Marinilabiliaceae bacterium]|nr:fibronectin type III domain-containing protein [Marinilabiliaceae bacterium]